MATTKKATAAVEWTAVEMSAGSWEIQHSAGRRFTEDEARLVAEALNGLRRVRVRIISSCLIDGRAVAAGSVLDLPLREAQNLVSNATVAELVPE